MLSWCAGAGDQETQQTQIELITMCEPCHPASLSLTISTVIVSTRGVSKIQQATPLLERFAWFTTRNYSATDSVKSRADSAKSRAVAPGDAALPYAYVALFDDQDGGLNKVGQAYRDL